GRGSRGEADGLADAVLVAVQLAADVLADPRHLVVSGLLEADPLGDVPAVDHQVVRIHALPAAVPVALGVHHLGAAAQRSGDVLHLGDLAADRVYVALGEGVEAARRHAHAAAGACHVGRDVEALRAEAGDHLVDLGLG